MIEYHLNEDDLLAFSLWDRANSATWKRELRRGRLAIAWWTAALFIVFTLAVAATLIRGLPILFTLSASAVVGAITWLLAWIVSRGMLERQDNIALQKLARQSIAQRSSGPWRIWIDESGVSWTSSSGTHHREWRSIVAVEETHSHVFLLVDTVGGLALPKSADPAGVAALASRIRAHLPGDRPLPDESALSAGSDEARPLPGGELSGRSPREAQPNTWVPPAGVVPLGEFGTASRSAGDFTPEPTAWPGRSLPMLSFVVGTDEIKATMVERREDRQGYERIAHRLAWRRLRRTLGIVFVIVLVAMPAVMRIGFFRSVLVSLGVVGLLSLIAWARLRWVITRYLPDVAEEHAQSELAVRGERRQVWADASGVTIADAMRTSHTPWEQVELGDTDQHILLITPTGRLAIPKRLGQPASAFLSFANSRVRPG